MKLVVTARELKWGSDRLVRGGRFEATTERDIKSAGLLIKIGKAALAPEPKPVRRVASTFPPPAAEPEPTPEPEAEPQPEPEPNPDVPEEDSADAPAPGRYRTRRLKAED